MPSTERDAKTPWHSDSRPKSPPESRSPEWTEEFRQLDCKHCRGLKPVEPDMRMMDAVQEMERQVVHQSIMDELQKLMMEGSVHVDDDAEFDTDDEDEVPELSDLPSPTQSHQAYSAPAYLLAMIPSSHRGSSPIPTTPAPPNSDSPIATHDKRMTIDLLPPSGVGALGVKNEFDLVSQTSKDHAKAHSEEGQSNGANSESEIEPPPGFEHKAKRSHGKQPKKAKLTKNQRANLRRKQRAHNKQQQQKLT